MHNDYDKKNENLNYCLDEEQIRALVDLEKITRKSINSQIKEGIDMYIKFQKGEAARHIEIFSPIVFDRPLREHDQ